MVNKPPPISGVFLDFSRVSPRYGGWFLTAAWKATVLPLNYARMFGSSSQKIEVELLLFFCFLYSTFFFSKPFFTSVFLRSRYCWLATVNRFPLIQDRSAQVCHILPSNAR